MAPRRAGGRRIPVSQRQSSLLKPGDVVYHNVWPAKVLPGRIIGNTINVEYFVYRDSGVFRIGLRDVRPVHIDDDWQGSIPPDHGITHDEAMEAAKQFMRDHGLLPFGSEYGRTNKVPYELWSPGGNRVRTAAPRRARRRAAPAPAPPVQPVVAAPRPPAVAAPRRPAVAAPRRPVVAAPRRPVVAAPRRPAVAAPRRRAVAAPRRPAVAAPRRPAVAAPRRPAVAAPRRPAVAAPVQPAVAAPVQPAIAAPVLPVVAAPVRPAATASANGPSSSARRNGVQAPVNVRVPTRSPSPAVVEEPTVPRAPTAIQAPVVAHAPTGSPSPAVVEPAVHETPAVASTSTVNTPSSRGGFFSSMVSGIKKYTGLGN